VATVGIRLCRWSAICTVESVSWAIFSWGPPKWPSGRAEENIMVGVDSDSGLRETGTEDSVLVG
jgi:hypothetical protein